MATSVQVTYQGPVSPVHLGWQEVSRGDTITVTPEVADSLAEQSFTTPEGVVTPSWVVKSEEPAL